MILLIVLSILKWGAEPATNCPTWAWVLAWLWAVADLVDFLWGVLQESLRMAVRDAIRKRSERTRAENETVSEVLARHRPTAIKKPLSRRSSG